MTDRRRPKAERRLQLSFSKSGLFSGLLVAGLVILAHVLIEPRFDRVPRPDAMAVVTFTPISVPGAIDGPFRLSGAWHVRSSDPRMASLSALAVDREGLIAVSDSGVAIAFPRPGSGTQQALFRDLPSGPGDPRRKSRRDAEALTRLADGDWLVAFENRHQLWRYDRDFRVGRRAIAFGPLTWPANRGIEAMAVDREGQILLMPESQGRLIVAGDVTENYKLASDGWTISDAAALPNGRILVAMRRITLGGFRNAIGTLTQTRAGWRVLKVGSLPLGRLDNAEGLAAETLADGSTRLWIVTDNDGVAYRRTLLLAVDLKR